MFAKSMLDFTNKVVLVTGSSAGIGESTALLFAQYGAKLSLVGRNKQNLQDVANRCEKEKGLKPLAIVADLGTDEGCERTARETLKHFGKLDVLVNNAGVGARTFLLGAEMETFDRVMNINLRGVYNLTRLLAPALIETKGNIVMVSSVMGTMVATGNLPYSISKAGLDHFSRIIAMELAPKGVRVNVISPGFTISSFQTRMTGYTEEEYRTWLQETERNIPLGRASTGADCARAILFLSSEGGSPITGAVLTIDGCMQFTGSASSELLKSQVK